MVDILRTIQNADVLREILKFALNKFPEVANFKEENYEVAWCALLALNSQVALVGLGCQMEPISLSPLLYKYGAFTKRVFSIFDMLFVEQLQHIQSNMCVALEIETLQYALYNCYDVRNLTK